MATSSIIIINDLMIRNGEFRFRARGHFTPCYACPFGIFSSICILENILCVYIVVVKIRRKDSKIFSFSLESVSDGPEGLFVKSLNIPKFPCGEREFMVGQCI